MGFMFSIQFFSFFIFFCAIQAHGKVYVDADCKCVLPANCEHRENPPVECGATGNVCCPTSAPVRTISTSDPSISDELTGTGEDKRLTTECGVGGAEYNNMVHRSHQPETILAIRNELPWVLEIFPKTDGDPSDRISAECGAVLIEFNIALTSADCVYNLKEEEIFVRAGIQGLNDEDPSDPTQDSEVLKIIMHPEYIKEGAINNIAVLVLAGFRREVNVNRICVGEKRDFALDSQCYIAGWGITRDGNRSLESYYEMKKIQLRLIKENQCTRDLKKAFGQTNFKLSKTHRCARPVSTSEEPGLGFGGAPLFCLMDRNIPKYSLLGIKARAVSNRRGVPGRYTAVYEYSSWLNKTIPQSQKIP